MDTASLGYCSNVGTIRAMQSSCSGSYHRPRPGPNRRALRASFGPVKPPNPRELHLQTLALRANSPLIVSATSSVQPSSVISTSNGAGFNCCKARKVTRRSTRRPFVVIITETVILTGKENPTPSPSLDSPRSASFCAQRLDVLYSAVCAQKERFWDGKHRKSNCCNIIQSWPSASICNRSICLI